MCLYFIVFYKGSHEPTYNTWRCYPRVLDTGGANRLPPFPGIEEHKNPDGSLFSKDQIITPAILTRATAFLKKEDKSFSRENIRGMTDIKAIIPPEIQEEIEKAKKAKKTYSFFPNQFRISLTLERSDILSIKERNRILLSIVDEYRKDFEKKYGEKPLVAVKFPTNFLENSDYLDAINSLVLGY